MKIKDPNTQREYDDAAFGVGQKIQAAGRVFALVEAPEYTLCMMEANPERFPQSDLQFAVEELKAYLETTGTDLKAKIEQLDPSHKGVCSAKDIEDVLMSFVPGIAKQCAITILRRFSGADGQFECEQLMSHVNF